MFDKHFVDETEKCPRCGSWDFEGGHATFDGPKVYQDCKCNECGYSWIDYYIYAYSVAEALPESEEDEIKRRVMEMGRWPLPCFPHPKSAGEIVALESFRRAGKLVSASVRVGGLGYDINFEHASYARNEGWDE